jgi:hypothetical protein
MGEIWFRNPYNYARELAEAQYGYVAWDRGILAKRNLDPATWSDLYFSQFPKKRSIVIGEQGTAEIDRDHPLHKPLAVYPTWSYGEEMGYLEELISDPVGEDEELCSDPDQPLDERPVFGQEHRVVVINPPNAHSLGGKGFYRALKQLQEDYPKCIIHLHGSYSYRAMFGLGYASADCDARTTASKGNVTLPNGKTIKFENAIVFAQWFTLLGMLPVEMSVPSKRCVFNIKSAVWAAENFAKEVNFATRKTKVDIESSDGEYKPKVLKFKNNIKPREAGDLIACDSCSLSDTCKFAREGSVCSIPGAEVSELGKYFQTRDSGMIIDGLGELMERSARRLEAGMASEEDMGELDPEVSKILTQLFDQGTKLAKLVDPALRGGAAVSVNVLNGGSGSAVQVAQGNPKEMIAGAMRELERQGIARKDITPGMIEGLLTGMVDPAARKRSIEGTVIASEDE